MSKFDDIRPYNDDEIRPAIDRLVNDKECIEALTRFRFPSLPNAFFPLITPLVKRYVKKQSCEINTVNDLQMVVKLYMQRMIDETTSGVHISGVENLKDGKPHLFISNHRDIAMDPALVNWALYTHQHDTLRIAIGDNLLTKSYVSDLMRANKSFIVNRSATAPREKLKAAKHLSAYIHQSITDDNANVWIAQREGRAKDGVDRTNSAVIGMLGLSKPKKVTLADYINELNIVPVSISYEYDPCDEAKAKELYSHKSEGKYEKDEHEDASSIAQGITGFKGDVHVHFGKTLQGNYQTTDDVVEELDKAVIENYHLHPSNIVAYRLLHGNSDADTAILPDCHTNVLLEHQQKFEKRMAKIDARWREEAIAMYANPLISQHMLKKQ
ncbi:1-acyl-sn-glycerol-3-phosphate acyltransferase [Eionea flava]